MVFYLDDKFVALFMKVMLSSSAISYFQSYFSFTRKKLFMLSNHI
jgi:hypothetical protein